MLIPQGERSISSPYEKEAILEVIEMRKILEAGIAALFAERVMEQDFWLMEDVLSRIEIAIERSESLAIVAAEFHVAVARATRHAVLAKLVKSFNHLMTKSGQLVSVKAGVEDLAGFKQNELSSHPQLYEIIREGSPQEAGTAMVRLSRPHRL